MSTSNKLLECCASICEGDGVSPRHEKNKETAFFYDNRRLCRQVQKLVRLAIAELGLDGWDITSVKQKNGKATLLIKIVPTVEASFSECEQALEWLRAHQSDIRYIVANGINRKSVPTLHFGLAREAGDE